ncbi:MAG: GntR family transcriptional regulator [Betaproteobacteria bacterium]
MAEQVHVRLRSDIVHARLRPGVLLSENQQALRLGVSRTPVRESIQRLVREGWVHVLPQRGTRVSLLSMDRIREALFVREAVETHGIRRLLRDAPAEAAWLRLERCLDAQQKALKRGDLEAIMQADAAFHRNMLELCGMGAVWPIVSQARDMHQRVRAIAVPELQSGEQALADHRAILASLRRRDADAAVLSMAHHLHNNEMLVQKIADLHPEYFEGQAHADRIV